MTIALPDPGKQDVQDHVQISHRFLDHAQKELNKGNRLQASEKVWGAVSHALKSIAEQRGWQHPDHASSGIISDQLGLEFNRRKRFDAAFGVAERMHQNYYRNIAEADTIQSAIEIAEGFVAELDAVRNQPPRSYQVTNLSEQSRLGRLLGVPLEERDAKLFIGKKDSRGFSGFDDRGNPRNPLDDTDAGGESSATRPPPDDSGPGPRGSSQPNGEPNKKPPRRPRAKSPPVGETRSPTAALNMLSEKPRKGVKVGKAPRPPMPVFPKVTAGKKPSTRAAPPGFNPPRLPGQRKRR